MTLALDILNVVLIGCAVLVVGGFALWIVIALIAFVEWICDHLPGNSGREYERYRAQQEIRSIRRQAVRDMLDAESAQRLAYSDPDIIEGTAVEWRS
ncbi:MAG: hypothetical protein ACYDHN_16490 [Solirubrobacteraceae bacterium]